MWFSALLIQGTKLGDFIVMFVNGVVPHGNKMDDYRLSTALSTLASIFETKYNRNLFLSLFTSEQ